MAAVTALPWLLVMGALWQMHTHSLSAWEHTQHRSSKHTQICALTLIHLHTKNHPFHQYSVTTSDKLPCTSHQSSRRWQIDKWSWSHPVILALQQTGSDCMKSSPALFFCLLLCLFSLCLPPEHGGSGEVHPGSNEPNARPECLLQPVPRDGLRQAQRVQGYL